MNDKSISYKWNIVLHTNKYRQAACMSQIWYKYDVYAAVECVLMCICLYK